MKISTEERFWSKVQSTLSGECWLWAASVDRDGYGKFGQPTGGWVRAHRWAYEHLVGPIPDGLVIDHLCRVRSCVNPSHMEPVTPRENTERGLRHDPNQCKYGHEYTPDNVYRRPDGWRECRICKRTLKRQYRERKKARLTREEPP